MKYLSKLLPVIAVLLALGGAIYYVLSEQPKPAAQKQMTGTHKSLVPQSYTNKAS